MRNLISILFIAGTINLAGQTNRLPKMAPIYSPGYYVSFKGDTVRGEVQVNPADETEFYKQFSFRLGGKGKKPRIITGQKAKAYGFDGKQFVMMVADEKKIFVERLVSGRLRFYELKFHGKKDGYPAVVSSYFIRDTGAEGADEKLKNYKKLPSVYYKKALKPYMKDQPMIWDDLDKYNFDERTVAESIKEFNKYYSSTSN